MANTNNVELVRGGIFSHQQQFGIEKRYPPNGVPKTKPEVSYSEEEKEFLSKPLIYHARCAD